MFRQGPRILTVLENLGIRGKGRRNISQSQVVQAQEKLDVLTLQLNFERVGNGPHPVLCLPGALGSIDTDFRPILDKMNKEKFTTIAWDPPGYGKSRPPNRDFSQGAKFFQFDAQVAKALMRKLGYNKFSILGWSDGGITGLVLSSLYTSNVTKLVVWGANAYVDEKDAEMYKSVKDIDTWSAKMKAPMIEMYGEDYFRKCWGAWVDTFQEIYKNGGDLCKEDLKEIKCPTLIVHGVKDPMVGLYHAEYLNQNIKNSKLHLMKEGKHNLHLRYPDEFISLVEPFLLS